MNDLSDQQLLRDYARRRVEAAFAELVRRHVDLVYSVAVRLVRDAHLAEDVTQAVFVALAGNAGRLAEHPVLSGWLHCTARNLATKAVRSDARRRAREQEAAAMNEPPSAESETTWDAIAPHLDAALGELNAADRDALMLRYFENKSASEMATLLSISDEAAQKRVSRAADRLRASFARRGVTVGAGGLLVAITAHAVQAAPLGLAATISAGVLAGGTVTASTVLAVSKTIAMTTLQKIIISAALTAAIGTGIYQARQAAQLRVQNQMLAQEPARLAAQIEQLQRALDEATNRLAGLVAENGNLKLNTNGSELLRLRGEVSRLRKANEPSQEADPREAFVKSWLERENQLKQAVKQNPDKSIPELNLLSEQDWLNAAMNGKFASDKEVRQTLAGLRHTAENAFVAMASDAVGKYAKANAGSFPAYLSELLPYFSTPVDNAILQRWEIVPQSALPNQKIGGDWVIAEKAPVDAELDSRWAIGPSGYGSGAYQSSDITAALATVDPALKAYAADNNGRQPSDPSQILQYLTTPEQQAAYQKLMLKYPTNSATP